MNAEYERLFKLVCSTHRTIFKAVVRDEDDVDTVHFVGVMIEGREVEYFSQGAYQDACNHVATTRSPPRLVRQADDKINDDGPPARRKDKPAERENLDAEYAEKIRSYTSKKKTPATGLVSGSDRPSCFLHGPLSDDPVCERCEWNAVCSPLPQNDSVRARSMRREKRRHFSRFFIDAHNLIYGYNGPNLHAADDIATRIQVFCLRERVDPRLFLLLRLVTAYDFNPHARFELRQLSGDWDAFTTIRSQIAQEHGCFDAQTICDSCDYHHLFARLAPLFEIEDGSEGARTGEENDHGAESKKHLFAHSVAKALGGDAEAAILYQHFRWWRAKSKEKQSKAHFHDGRYWRYDSLDSLLALFPYMSRSTINRRLLKLEKFRYLDFGNFNRLRMDKTRWFHARAKDSKGVGIEAGGNISFWVEDAVQWKSVVHACVLAVVRRKIDRNRDEGKRPVALLAVNQFCTLLPFKPRTIRRAITDLVRCENLGLREINPPEGFVENEGIKSPRDARLQPKLYYLASPALDEYFTAGKFF